MVDINSHILYNLDNGSKDEIMTLEMLRLAEQSGTTKMIATPSLSKYRNIIDISEAQAQINKINLLARENNINVEVFIGQQVYYSKEIVELYKEEKIITLNNSRYMLIELPIDNINKEEVLSVLNQLIIVGVKPIICYPERCFPFIENPDSVIEFLNNGVMFSLCAGSIIGDFGRDSKRLAKKYLNKDVYSFLGSDARRSTVRNPDMREAIKKIEKINSKYIYIFTNNGFKIIKNNN